MKNPSENVLCPWCCVNVVRLTAKPAHSHHFLKLQCEWCQLKHSNDICDLQTFIIVRLFYLSSSTARIYLSVASLHQETWHTRHSSISHSWLEHYFLPGIFLIWNQALLLWLVRRGKSAPLVKLYNERSKIMDREKQTLTKNIKYKFIIFGINPPLDCAGPDHRIYRPQFVWSRDDGEWC